MKILVLGASGMLGNAMLRVLAEGRGMEVYGTARSASVRRCFSPELGRRVLCNIDAGNHDAIIRVLSDVKPEVVVNCIGLVRQLAEAADPLAALPINAVFPHQLGRLCGLGGIRLVHFSTDCVFAGTHGNYLETDLADAADLYGRSKYLGEVTAPHAITLRTSIIGHELASAHSLIGWFLSQKGRVSGYARAVFSGLPSVELARVVRDIILPRPDLSGLYHIAAAPIVKLDLLRLVAATYGKTIEIVPDETVSIDRSLNAERFRAATGYVAPPWPELVNRMFEFR